MTPPKRLHPALRRHRHGVVAHRELRAAGMSPEAIRHARRVGHLHDLHRGVYAVGRPDLTREGRWVGAVLALGDDAGLAHVPAGLVWAILERGDERPHVSVPASSHRVGPAGVVVHRAAGLRPVVRNQIPVTPLDHTIVDLAGDLRPNALKAAIRRAVQEHDLDLRALRSTVALPLSDWRKARVRRVVDLWVPGVELTQSELEARLYELVAGAGLPLPELQRPFGPYRSDFVWDAAKLVVETDGRHHLSAVARQADAARDRALAAAGFLVLRYMWADVVNRPREVVREIRAALARRHLRAG